MNNLTRWSVGLQWGACAWLAYVAFRASTAAIAPLFHLLPSSSPGFWPSAVAWLMAPVWIAALVSVCCGVGWSRIAVGVAICAQVVVGTTEAAGYGGPLGLPFALRFFGPMSLPLLPLVVLRAAEPRAVLVSLAGGWWREALGRFGGLRTSVVAVALISLNRGAYDILTMLR
jgi:hypothetical protein